LAGILKQMKEVHPIYLGYALLLFLHLHLDLANGTFHSSFLIKISCVFLISHCVILLLDSIKQMLYSEDPTNYKDFHYVNLLRFIGYFSSVTSSAVVLGGIVVTMVATRLKVRGFKPGRGLWIFKDDTIRSTTSFGGKIKQSVPCRKILRHVKDRCKYERDTCRPNSRTFIAKSFTLLLGASGGYFRELWWVNQK
jgi:hypothetical protein